MVFIFLFHAMAGISWGQIASMSPHGELSIEVDCASCHRTEGWTPLLQQLEFDHNRQTRFTLTGSHTDASCSSCHLNNRFDEPAASATDCAVCHIDVHQGALSEACVDCHNTTLFQEVEGISAHTQTNFPLTGAHSQITCTSCHTDDTDGAFTALPTACVDCHEDDYERSVIVDHVAADFSLECESCHTDLQWQGAIFDHFTASNGFNLVGAHEGLACASCHQTPDLVAIHQPANDLDCISCHQADYDDEHAGTGIQTTCLDCHNQQDWDDVDFDHDRLYFPIFSGNHKNTWNSCQSCHLQPDNFATFSCLGACHEHTEPRMNNEHDEVRDYVYEFNACLRCHPNGDE